MKNLLLSVALSAMCLSLSATPQGEVKESTLANIVHLKATKQEVRDNLGEPDKIMAFKDYTHWQYNGKEVNIQIQWDEETNQITNLQYTSRNNKSEAWVSDWQKKLEIEKSTFDQILKQLGMPSGVIATNKEQQSVEYRYSNYMLRMLFKEGLLIQYELSKA